MTIEYIDKNRIRPFNLDSRITNNLGKLRQNCPHARWNRRIKRFIVHNNRLEACPQSHSKRSCYITGTMKILKLLLNRTNFTISICSH